MRRYLAWASAHPDLNTYAWCAVLIALGVAGGLRG